MAGPNYFLQSIDLTAAGTEDINVPGNLLVFVTAVGAGGVVDLDAKVTVILSTTVEDGIPLAIGNKVFGETRIYRLSWAAQPGVAATFLISRLGGAEDGVDIETRPPKQLVTTSKGTVIVVGAVTVGVAEILIKAASSVRQALTIQNLGAAAIYIGPGGVLTTTGIEIAALGGSITIEGSTAAVYGISGVAGNEVRFLQEE